MLVMIKNKRKQRITYLDFEGKVPTGIGFPVLTGISSEIIIGYAWFKRIKKTSRKYNMPVYEFNHFKIKP